jgi:hypothetical protein
MSAKRQKNQVVLAFTEGRSAGFGQRQPLHGFLEKRPLARFVCFGGLQSHVNFSRLSQQS